MTTFKTFTCAECGGTVRMLPGAGEKREFRRDVVVRVPSSVKLPKCDGCGELYLAPEDSARIDAALEAAYLEWQRAHYGDLVDRLKRRHGATLRTIERICGVTPSYFSHVMKGRRIASVTLTRLLEALVAAPSEYMRHANGLRESTIALGIRSANPYAIEGAVPGATLPTWKMATPARALAASDLRGVA